ncbi:MAG: hypothetical protein QW791_07670 [Candidatus Bathyarchaeia archaeon]
MNYYGCIFRTTFDEFCKYLDGKLLWSETKDREWTETIFEFFSNKNKAEATPFVEIKDYMRVDYVWRYDPKKYSVNDIELAVEHEGVERDISTLLDQELQHLIDLKARNKIGIFYPNLGDEKSLIDGVGQRIKAQSNNMILPL